MRRPVFHPWPRCRSILAPDNDVRPILVGATPAGSGFLPEKNPLSVAYRFPFSILFGARGSVPRSHLRSQSVSLDSWLAMTSCECGQSRFFRRGARKQYMRQRSLLLPSVLGCAPENCSTAGTCSRQSGTAQSGKPRSATFVLELLVGLPANLIDCPSAQVTSGRRLLVTLS